jgi:hypothetical protein
MARVWFVRRRGVQWVAPGGAPACERPLEDLVFRLDLGPHRYLSDETPLPDPTVAAVPPQELLRVMIETTSDDLSRHPFSGYAVGYYDSPYSPGEAAHRLGLGLSERAAPASS